MTNTTHTGDAPDGLLDAFWRYESALRSNDIDTLDELFVDSPDTIRVDPSGVQRGSESIARFRRLRSAPARRTISELHVTPISDAAAVVIIATELPDAGRGAQTQVWVKADDGAWAVRAAHVSTAQPPTDRSIWRVLGNPLLKPAAAGRLDGVGVAVKDLFAVQGHRVGAGVPVFLAEQQPATANAPAVAALLEEGAVVIGIAHTDEFAFGLEGTNPHYGTPRNPRDGARLPGGSSGAPAAAVGSGLADLALVTDTAGSARVPASFQGLWGLRTTVGLVPTTGMEGLAPRFDSVGYISADPELLDTVLRTTDRFADHDPMSSALPLITVPELLQLAEEPVRAAFDRFRSRRDVRALSVDLDLFGTWFQAFRLLQSHEAWALRGAWITAHPDALASSTRERFATGSSITPKQLEAATALLDGARTQLLDLLEGSALVLPAAGTVAPPTTVAPAELQRSRDRTLRLNALASLAGLPSVSAPFLVVDGLPVGVSFTTAPGSDLAAVRTAITNAPERASA
jgi:Asp-tRNA(Asn)/Glu-tRNA(Gln) amidotransferase A subunit family amidase